MDTGLTILVFRQILDFSLVTAALPQRNHSPPILFTCVHHMACQLCQPPLHTQEATNFVLKRFARPPRLMHKCHAVLRTCRTSYEDCAGLSHCKWLPQYYGEVCKCHGYIMDNTYITDIYIGPFYKDIPLQQAISWTVHE